MKVTPDRLKVSLPSTSDAVSVASSSSCLLVFSFSSADLATVSGFSSLQANTEGTASRFNLRFFRLGIDEILRSEVLAANLHVLVHIKIIGISPHFRDPCLQ